MNEMNNTQQDAGTVDAFLEKLHPLEGDVHQALHPPVDALSRQRTIEGALQRRPRERRNGWWLATGVAAAVLLGFGVLVQLGPNGANDDLAVAQMARPQSKLPQSAFTLLEGEVDCNDANVQLGASVPVNAWIETGNGHTAISIPSGIAVGLGEQSAMRVLWPGGGDYTVEMRAGTALFSVDPQSEREQFVVNTPTGRIFVTGTLFSVTVHDSGDSEVLLHKGQIVVVGDNQQRVVVHRGHAVLLARGAAPQVQPLASSDAQIRFQMKQLACMDGGEVFSELDKELCARDSTEPGASDAPVASALPSEPPVSAAVKRPSGDRQGQKREVRPSPTFPSSKPPSASELVEMAGVARTEGRHNDAVEALNQLLKRYPQSADAHTAMVTLGRLFHRQLGNPAAAAWYFTDYLQTPGPLTMDALMGKAKAERDLGRSAAERQTLQSILAHESSGPMAVFARKRLAQIDGQ